MKLKAFCVYDSKIEAYMMPFFLRSQGEAKRAIIETALDKNTQVSRYPADYTLFEIGGYDDETGTLYPHAAKISLGSIQDLQKTRLAEISHAESVSLQQEGY